MSNADITKHVIAEGIKEMMQSIPLSHISVGDISNHCKISRNTFYYHFQDKFDLINWIFYTEITPIISDIVNINCWSHGLYDLCSYLQKNKKFYINALSVEGQNSFSQCLMEFYESLIQNMLREINYNFTLSNFEIELTARFYSHSLVGIILDWAKNGMEPDPAPYVEIIEKLINGSIFQQAVKLRNSQN